MTPPEKKKKEKDQHEGLVKTELELTTEEIEELRKKSQAISLAKEDKFGTWLPPASGSDVKTKIEAYEAQKLLQIPEDKDKWKGTKFEGKSAQEIVVQNNNYTIAMLLPMWMDNFAHNVIHILDESDVSLIPKRDGSGIIIGGGPSLKQLNQLEQLGKSNYRGTIIATDRVLIDCLRNDIVPEFVTSTDGDPSRVAAFYNHKLVKEYAPKMNLVIITTIHPSVAKIWREINGGKIYWFNAFLDDPEAPTSLTKAMHFMTRKTILHVPGNNGAFAWNLALTIGCNPVCLIGMDYGYTIDTPLEQTSYYYKFMATYGNNLEEVKKLYKEGVHPFFDTKYLYDIMWDGYKTMFLPYLRKAVSEMGVKIISSSPCHLWDQSIENMHFTSFLKKYEK